MPAALDEFADDDSFPMVGATINLLVNFVQENGGNDAFAGLTTDDVKNRFVIPATIKTQQSMCQQLQAGGDKRIGRPTWFVSHAWKYTFLQLLQVPRSSPHLLQSYCNPHPPHPPSVPHCMPSNSITHV